MTERREGYEPSERKPWRPSWRFLGILAAIALLVFGNIHIINGSQTGLRVWQKKSFSLSEIYVNTDELGNMPAFLARAKYPMTIAVMSEKLIEAKREPDLRHDNVKRVQLGMSRYDVIQTLGEPLDKPEWIGDTLYMRYSSALQGRYVSIELERDRVTKIRD